MADCPPNLDDGELWIPSDILFNDAASSYKSQNASTMDYLSQRLEVEALDFGKSNINRYSETWHNFPPNSQRCIPVANYDEDLVSTCYLNHNGYLQRHICCGYGTASCIGGPKMFFVYGRRDPPWPQVNGMQQTKGMFLQMQQNCPLPFQPSGCRYGYGIGGFTRGSRGTGVFHPQAVNNWITSFENTSSKSLKKKDECSVALKRREQRSAGLGNRKECHPSLSAEMRLPKDWTY